MYDGPFEKEEALKKVDELNRDRKNKIEAIAKVRIVDGEQVKGQYDIYRKKN